jgi:hypothetical protein
MARTGELANYTEIRHGRHGTGRPGEGHGAPVLAARRVFDFESVHQAPAAVVFPLLCPVREYDWIEDWRCQVLHSESGVAEEDCLFVTDVEGCSTWVVTAHEPPARVEFCIFNEREVVARLKIRLEATEGGGCRLCWRRIYTAVGPHGTEVVEALDPHEVEMRMLVLVARLDHWLTHGEPLLREPGREGVMDET